LRLRVTDDGKGFAPLRANRMTGLGLTGMRERIEGVGGTFDVRSAPGTGTRIEAEVPLPAGALTIRKREA
jgi:signal transduction histidine kinase